MITRRSKLGCLLTVLTIATVLGGCGIKETGVAPTKPIPSLMSLPAIQWTAQPTSLPIGQPTAQSTAQPTPTSIVLGPLFDLGLDIKAAPVEVPLELKIPSLKVNAPVLGVGLTSENEMDAPKGPIGDPVWHTAFWYRGSGLPGESGTATIAGHVNDPLGRDEIFARLQDLQPGDLIIIHYTKPNIDFTFTVDQVEIYSLQESSDPAVLAQIYGTGPVSGTAPQPSLDGLSHLTLITCAGNIVNGQFDHHVVVYATPTK
ncbi:MAG: sortase [Chloroflexi bacterium]|nr:MAG: sortase [Chloroflexota bacterium]